MNAEQMTAVADAAEALGYEGTDASVLISLAEYGFVARKGTPFVEGSAGDNWDVLIYVPSGYPGGAGFKFVGFDGDADLWDITDELHELRQPNGFAASSAAETLVNLRCYHDPNAEASADEARAVLEYAADMIGAHQSGHAPIPPHLTDRYTVAQYAANHRDPVVLLTREAECNCERRRTTAKGLLSTIEDRWRKIPTQHGVGGPRRPKTDWEYSF
jgi:hypothetical protein